MIKAFIDTNVLLDVLARREPFYADAARLWSLCERGRVTGCVSVISFNNIYYVVRKAESKDRAEEALTLIRDVFTAVDLSAQVLGQAIDAGFDDFEDAIQFHSAVHAEASCLVTRNPDHFPFGSVPILSPREFLAVHDPGGQSPGG